MKVRRVKARIAAGLVVLGLVAVGFGLSSAPAQAAAVGGAGNLTLTISCNGAGSDQIVWSADFTGLLPSSTYTFLFTETISGNQGEAEPEIPVHFATDATGAWTTAPVRAVNIHNVNAGPGPLNYYVGDSYPWSISDGVATVLSGTAVAQNGVGPCGGTTTSVAAPTTSAPATHTSTPVTHTSTVGDPGTSVAPTSAAVSSGGGQLAETGASHTGLLLVAGAGLVLLGLVLLVGARTRAAGAVRRH
jgi:LPXTG-motif cell wall-anchored protein